MTSISYLTSWRRLASQRDDILELCEAVNASVEMHPPQWAALMALAMDFAPDLVLELGRHYGNSTCAFIEASHLTPPSGACRVLSLDVGDEWQAWTVPRLRPLVPAGWFSPLQAVRADILTFDFETALAGAERVLVFWDAHGFEVAECMLGRILPLLEGREHLVIMHDLSDTRHHDAARDYAGQRLWKGNDWSGPRVRLRDFDTTVEQGVAIVDFTSRNTLSLRSIDHELHRWSEQHPDETARLHETLGPLFSLSTHLHAFSLNEHAGPHTFPRFEPPSLPPPLPWRARLSLTAKILLGRDVRDHFRPRYW